MFYLYLYIFLLAFIQGVTEFLPVSSSGHLLIASSLFGAEDQGIVVDIALHIGSLFAVLCFYFQDVKLLVINFLKKGADKSLLIKIFIATLPAVFLGGCFFIFGVSLRNPNIVIFTSIVFGIILYIADRFGKHTKEFKDISYKDALIVGIAQAVATIPGVSRSGITTTSLLGLNFRREDALKFSFLISMPIIFLAGIMGVFKFVSEPQSVDLFVLFFAIFASFIFSMLAIKFMMFWVKKSSFKVFAIYRILLGVFLYFFLK